MTSTLRSSIASTSSWGGEYPCNSSAPFMATLWTRIRAASLFIHRRRRLCELSLSESQFLILSFEQPPPQSLCSSSSPLSSRRLRVSVPHPLL
ncbi:unnamed protein product [Linum tenue]|uniref:Uncharacterized protein n=1 Tax=Linum tenue TaxID=586396 RepID=A0AAV0R0Q7_9ROSI|nr:unnamed protein product [Linum tenue]